MKHIVCEDKYCEVEDSDQNHFDVQSENINPGPLVTETSLSTVPLSTIKSRKRRSTKGRKVTKKIRRVQVGAGKRRTNGKKKCGKRKCVRRKRGRK